MLVQPAEGEFEHRARLAPAPVILVHGRNFFRGRDARQLGKARCVDLVNARALALRPQGGELRPDCRELFVAHDLAAQRPAFDMAHEEPRPKSSSARSYRTRAARERRPFCGLHQRGFWFRGRSFDNRNAGRLPAQDHASAARRASRPGPGLLAAPPDRRTTLSSRSTSGAKRRTTANMRVGEGRSLLGFALSPTSAWALDAQLPSPAVPGEGWVRRPGGGEPASPRPSSGFRHLLPRAGRRKCTGTLQPLDDRHVGEAAAFAHRLQAIALAALVQRAAASSSASCRSRRADGRARSRRH